MTNWEFMKLVFAISAIGYLWNHGGQGFVIAMIALILYSIEYLLKDLYEQKNRL